MNILQLRIEDIDAGRRLRPVDADYVHLIAASMAEHGQMTPIEVMASPGGKPRPYTLVAGAHRLAAAVQAGLPTIQAMVFEGSELEAELREIDENLIRHELKELDRSVFLARRKEVYERLHPQTKRGGDRRSDQVGSVANLIVRFTASAAERLALSESSISRAIRRYTNLAPDVREQIAPLWIADHGAQLDVLAKLKPEMQREVALIFVRFPGVRSVGEALAQVEGREPEQVDPDEAQFDQFARLWRRMGAASRGRAAKIVQAWAEKQP